MDSYDIIFAGGGASACVTAGRLAEADPSLKILILESGPHTEDNIHHIQPSRYFGQLSPSTNQETFTYNKGAPSASLLRREPVVPSAHTVGGGSSVNFAVYTRPAASDFDDWENLHGNCAWGSEKMIPLLKKAGLLSRIDCAETYQPESSNDTYGTDGPLKISFSKEHINVDTEFIAASVAYDKRRAVTDDPNDSMWSIDMEYIDGQTGRRSDTAHHYIYNKGGLHNIQVLAGCRIVRVLFENTRAVGVEFVKSRHDISTAVKATRLVVIAAGAFGSPAILERSGVGAKDILLKLGIEVLMDLPGVGENYMDHIGPTVPFYGSEETESLDNVFRGNEKDLEVHNKEWFEKGTGFLTQNAVDAGVKLRPNAAELQTMSPDFDHQWKTYFENASDKPALIMLSYSAWALWLFVTDFATDYNPDSYFGGSPVKTGIFFSIAYFLCYPASTGRVHITSGVDAYSPPDFYAGFLDDAADIAVLRWGYKKARECARRMRLYRGEIRILIKQVALLFVQSILLLVQMLLNWLTVKQMMDELTSFIGRVMYHSSLVIS